MNTSLVRSSKMFGAIAGLVVLAVAMLWFAAGSGTVAQAADAPDADPADGTVNEEEEAWDESPLEVPALESVVLGRDPFESIRPEVTPEPETTTPASTAATITPVATEGEVPVSTDGREGTSRETGGAAELCRASVEAVCEGTVVVLLDIQDTGAVIQVDGESYLVSAGDTFAGERFQLLRIGDGCAEIVYRNGDVAEVFTQCPGSPTLK